MKIEVAPWIEDYMVDMADLFTELELEKIHNKPMGQENRLLKDYTEFFTEKGEDEPSTPGGMGSVDCVSENHLTVRRRKNGTGSGIIKKLEKYKKDIGQAMKFEEEKHRNNIQVQKAERQKVLLKGDPGIGKTTLLKKIGWDWALKIFGKFVIVFVVFLKLVKPGDAIENAIIQQTPVLEGLNVTKGKLKRILEESGDQCLVILDGLDEHVTGENCDVLKMIRGQKYVSCNIVVSSRPHSTKTVEKYFQTIVRVNGFTINEARKFAAKMVKSVAKVESILKFQPVDIGQEKALYNYPILLSFLCLLVREDDIDIASEVVPIGEIYTRMIRCLYKKYVLRKRQIFSSKQFVSILRSVGRLALDTLLSGNPLFRRSEVIREVGEDAFDYGLLIGCEEGHRLIRDETANIFVTFAHRSIQEFFGAFYFVERLSDGSSIEDIIGVDCREPIFMTDPLFLQFCLWFLLRSQDYFAFSNSAAACAVLQKYCARTIAPYDLVLPSITETFPALKVEEAVASDDRFMLIFFTGIFQELCNINVILVKYQKSLDWIMSSLRPLLQTVRQVIVEKLMKVICLHNSELLIHVRSVNVKALERVLIEFKFREMCSIVHYLDYSKDRDIFLITSLSVFNLTLSHTLNSERLHEHFVTIEKSEKRRVLFTDAPKFKTLQ